MFKCLPVWSVSVNCLSVAVTYGFNAARNQHLQHPCPTLFLQPMFYSSNCPQKQSVIAGISLCCICAVTQTLSVPHLNLCLLKNGKHMEKYSVLTFPAYRTKHQFLPLLKGIVFDWSKQRCILQKMPCLFHIKTPNPVVVTSCCFLSLFYRVPSSVLKTTMHLLSRLLYWPIINNYANSYLAHAGCMTSFKGNTNKLNILHITIMRQVAFYDRLDASPRVCLLNILPFC